MKTLHEFRIALAREWGVVIAAGTIVGTIVSITTLMWYGMERIHQSEVARIKGDAETAQARIKGDAETAQARIKGEAEFMERFHQSEIARIKGEADNKVEMYQYYVQPPNYVQPPAHSTDTFPLYYPPRP